MLGYITDPAAAHGLARRELPDPSPAPSDCVVEVRAFAVNRGEIGLLQQRSNGWTPGQDVAGIVDQTAADGSGPPQGTRVVGIADQGGWSQRVAIPSYRIAPIPDAVSFAEAAALPVAGLTALRALRTGGPLMGRRVLITGASGGVGTFAVQLAALAGAEVTALVSGPHRVEAVRELGVDTVVTALDESAGRFDHILDGVGGQVMVDALHHLAPGGTMAAYGNASGEKAQLVFGDFRGATGGRLMGFFVYATDIHTFGDDLGYLARLIGAGKLRVHFGAARDWAEAGAVIDLLRQHETAGKVVLTIDGGGA